MTYFYYTKDKEVFYNRYDAIKSGKPVTFFFHEDVFSKVDWKKEPAAPLQQLYRERAEQIRRDYEYIILMYSGGIDSSNVLETFIKNDIPLDEIAMVGAFSQDTALCDNNNSEIYKSALPILKEINPTNTKIRMADYTYNFNDPNKYSLLKKYGSDWVKHIGSYYSPQHICFWNDIRHHLDHGTSKKTAIIIANEKPFMYYQNNVMYIYFIDSSFTSYANWQKEDNYERVNFYTSTESIDLMKKQYHSILNKFINLCFFDKKISPETFMNNYISIAKKIIYNLDYPIKYSNGKSMSHVLSKRDEFLLNKKDSNIFRLFMDGIKKLPPNHIHLDTNQEDGALTLKKELNVPTFRTRSYALCDPLPKWSKD